MGRGNRTGGVNTMGEGGGKLTLVEGVVLALQIVVNHSI